MYNCPAISRTAINSSVKPALASWFISSIWYQLPKSDVRQLAHAKNRMLGNWPTQIRRACEPGRRHFLQDVHVVSFNQRVGSAREPHAKRYVPWRPGKIGNRRSGGTGKVTSEHSSSPEPGGSFGLAPVVVFSKSSAQRNNINAGRAFGPPIDDDRRGVGEAGNVYETKEAAFESAVAAASLALRQGHEVRITVPGRSTTTGAANAE